MKTKAAAIGYIKTDLKGELPVYAHSGVCVISKSSVSRFTSTVKFTGEFQAQQTLIEDLNLIKDRDYFVMTREAYIKATGSAQMNQSTIMITLSGLRKIRANAIMARANRTRTSEAIAQLAGIEQQLQLSLKPCTHKNIIPKVVKLKPEPVTNEANLDTLIDLIIERITDKAIQRLLRA